MTNQIAIELFELNINKNRNTFIFIYNQFAIHIIKSLKLKLGQYIIKEILNKIGRIYEINDYLHYLHKISIRIYKKTKKQIRQQMQ